MVKQLLEKIDKDKLLHFIAGVMVYQGTFWLIGYYALVVVALCAISKEVCDHYYNGTTDIYDAAATILGGLVCLG